MFFSSVLDAAQSVDEKQVQSFFSHLTLEKLIYAAVLLVLSAVLIRLILKAADKLSARSTLDRTVFGFVRAAIKAILIFICVMLVAGTLGIDTSSLLAILSVAGLAISLSVQNTLSNVAGAITLLSAKPIRAGDYVQIGDKAGIVQTIGAMYTSLRTYDYQLIYIPNSQVTASAIINYTAQKQRRVELTVSASYQDSVERVCRVLVQAAEAYPKHLSEPAPAAHVTSYGDSAISYTLRFWVQTEDYWDAYFAVLDAFKQAFEDAGVTMTYPHINVHMDS